ncbi:MAG: glycosyltransferase family 4 protein [Planctomycetota bacterium]
MRICLITHEYEPFPGGGIATYTDAASRELAARGHEVHVITNRATYGSNAIEHNVPVWKDGNLTVHRLALFNRDKKPQPQRRFLETNPKSYPRPESMWPFTASNLAAAHIAEYVASLHKTVGLDILEVPEYFAEAFYIERQRRSGRRAEFPPVCIIGHTSSRQLLSVSRLVNELGRTRQREMMSREDYCIRTADALQTPSESLMQRYRDQFGAVLSEHKLVLPYYLDVSEAADELPPRLRGRRYICAVGRIEPRKGSDVLLRAFAKITDKYPDVQLAYFGREAWRAGESFADLVDEELTDEQQKRLLFMGNRARAEVLRSVQESAVFAHPAPWDNYPNSVLEAMAVGATCLVSDSGGQGEMVEDGKSGIVRAAGDVDAYAEALDQLLSDPQLAKRYGEGAKERVAFLTNADRVTGIKVEFFEKIAAAEQAALASAPPTINIPGLGAPRKANLGPGMVVIDAGTANSTMLTATADSVQDQLLGQDGWRVYVIANEDISVGIPNDWQVLHPLARMPWQGADEGTLVAFLRAGVRFDRDGLANLADSARNHSDYGGAFAWLRTKNVQHFPFAQDSGVAELLAEGSTVQAAFCTHAERLKGFPDLAGLGSSRSRMVALMAASAAQANAACVHTGALEGDDYGPMSTVDEETQGLAIGWLQVLGLIPDHVLAMFSRQIRIIEGKATRVADHGMLKELEELREIRNQHEKLKSHRLVRVLRKAGVFNAMRRLSSKSSGFIGPGANRSK